MFLSRVNFLCWSLFGVSSTPILPQWHIKDPCHSAQSAGGRLHLHTHTLLTQLSWGGLIMLSRSSVGTYLRNELTSNWSGNVHSQSSQLTKPLRTNPGLKHGSSAHKQISTFKKKEKLHTHLNPPPPQQILACKEKATTTTTVYIVCGCTGWMRSVFKF